MEQETMQEKKQLPLLVGIAAIVIVAGAFLFFVKMPSQSKLPSRDPDIAGLIDLWEVDGSKIYTEIAPGGKRLLKQAITIDSSTKYIHKKGRKGDADRAEETGALANISDGIYVGIFLKPETQIADTIIYADWPL
ncbi:MAG: hypothetical protein AAB367_01195 [Patescibacteria group bacterium]